MGLAGIMFWALDLDDFTGEFCNEGKYPLMNTAVNLLRGQPEWTTPTAPTTTTTLTTTTTTASTLAQQKRVVCYYTKSVNIKTLFIKKKKNFCILAGHNIVLMEENFFPKILMLHYVLI